MKCWNMKDAGGCWDGGSLVEVGPNAIMGRVSEVRGEVGWVGEG